MRIMLSTTYGTVLQHYSIPTSVGQVEHVEHVEQDSRKSRDVDTVTESVDTSMILGDVLGWLN